MKLQKIILLEDGGNMRIVMFMASQYGLECYRALGEMADIEIAGILTTPAYFVLKYDKNKTKEMKNTIYREVITENETKCVPVYVTDKMNSEKSVSVIRSWKPDLIVVSGWYHIIKEEVLEIPPKGIVGLHSSLLPHYRGGAPLVWQLINGEKQAGITLFYMERGTDTGDVIGQRAVTIEEDDDIGTLYKKIGEKGIELLRDYIPQIAADCAPRKQQMDVERYRVYPQRKPEDGRIDWSQNARDIYNFVRAQTKPYPGAFSTYDGYLVSIWKCKIKKTEGGNDLSGTILNVVEKDGEKHPVVSTGERGYVIEIIDYNFQVNDEKIQMEKGKRLT